MSYLTQTDYNRFYTLPISLPETELRTRCYIQVCTFRVTQGMVMEMACCHLQVLRILTPGVTPTLADSSLGLASVGLLASSMLSGAVGLVTQNAVGTKAWNADQPVVVTAPGVYRVVVINNSINVDLAVLVTGAVRVWDVGQPVQVGQFFTPAPSAVAASTDVSNGLVLPAGATPPVVEANVAPTITTQPTDMTVRASTLPIWPSYSFVPVTLSVVASGTAPLSYQWQTLSTDDGINWITLKGATASTYDVRTGKLAGIPAAAFTTFFRYLSKLSFRCVITNGFGAVTSTVVRVIAT